MRILKTLTFALVLTTTPAWADSVVFTGGSAWIHQGAGFDPVFNITGENTQLRGSRALGLGPLIVTTGTTNLLINTGGIVLINGVQYGSLSQAGGDQLGLRMTFLHEPVPISAVQSNFMDTPGLKFSTPFTMTGTLAVLDLVTNGTVTFDVSGSGALDISKVPDPLFGIRYTHIDFNFGKAATPVPESPWLLTAGLAVLGLLKLHRNRR